MKARYWSMGVVLGGLIVAGTAWAALDCGVKPTCAELGYTDTADQCDDSGMLKCPFDETAVFCRKKAPVIGVGCEVGSVLYSDLNCYDTAPSGLTAVGVVVDSAEKLAVGLNYAKLPWAENNNDLSEVLCKYDKNVRNNDLFMMQCAIDGKANTKEIVDYYGSGTDYAAGYCHNYTTEGTKKGDWFLPSVYQGRKFEFALDAIDIDNVLEAANLTLYCVTDGTTYYGRSATTVGHEEERRENYSTYCFLNYGNSIDIPSKECKVGDVLYSDLKCHDKAPANLDAVGVVFDEDNRLAVELNENGIDQLVDDSPSSGYIKALFDNCIDLDEDSCSVGGLYNTMYVSANAGAISTCRNKIADLPGYWFLPSMNELKALYTVKDKVSTTLSSAGGDEIGTSKYWSSTPRVVGQYPLAWGVNMATGEYYSDTYSRKSRFRCLTYY